MGYSNIRIEWRDVVHTYIDSTKPWAWLITTYSMQLCLILKQPWKQTGRSRDRWPLKNPNSWRIPDEWLLSWRLCPMRSCSNMSALTWEYVWQLNERLNSDGDYEGDIQSVLWAAKGSPLGEFQDRFAGDLAILKFAVSHVCICVTWRLTSTSIAPMCKRCHIYVPFMCWKRNGLSLKQNKK